MANLFVDVHHTKPTQTLFLDGDCFLIPFIDTKYSLGQTLLMVLADGSTSSLLNALYDYRSSGYDMAFHEILAEIYPNLRQQLQVSW